MKGQDTVIAFFVVLIIIGTIMSIIVGAMSWYYGYTFDRDVGSYFELSDKASSVDLKLQYFNQFITALNDNDLNKGQSALFMTTKDSDLENNFNVAMSLQKRLVETNSMTRDFGYQTAMQQLITEYCWFPIDAFRQGYYMNKGIWILALFPASTNNRCSTPTSR